MVKALVDFSVIISLNTREKMNRWDLLFENVERDIYVFSVWPPGTSFQLEPACSQP